MFLIKRIKKELKKYSVELEHGLSTVITTFDDFYQYPEKVSSYEFPDETNVTTDEKIRPVYDFIAKISGININKRKGNIVKICTQCTQNNYGSAYLNAFVNLGDQCEFIFYRKDEIVDIIPEETDSDEEPSDDDPGRMPVDDECFTEDVIDSETVRLLINYNELVIYDPHSLILKTNSTKFQVFILT